MDQTSTKTTSRLSVWLRAYTALDMRSLATFRIALGLVLIADIFNRLFYLQAHYSDFGVLPRGALLGEFQKSSWIFSLHFINGSVLFQGFLFLLALLFAVLLTLGFSTRLATICSWILLISLHSRNPMVLQGGDDFLRLLLFWGMFLPLANCFSFDSLRQKQSKSLQYSSLACFALIVQIASVYLCTMIFKVHPVWYEDFTAVEQALHVDQFTKPLGYVLLQYPDFLRFLTRATVAVEWAAVVLLFMPFFIKECRLAASLLLIGFHLFGLHLTMELGLFPWICAVAWLAILPSTFWNFYWVDFSLQKAADFGKRLYSAFQPLPRFAPCYLPAWKVSTPTQAIALAKNIFIGLCLLYVSLWNVRELYPDKVRPYFPISMNWFGHVFRIDQRWSMFSPKPLTEDGWYVIPGKLRDQTEVNVFTPEVPLTYKKPQDVASTYPSQRWRKYMMNIWLAKHKQHRLYYGKYLCRSWNVSHDHSQHLMTFQIVFMKEDTLPDGSEADPEKVVLWRHHCFKKEET